MFFRYPTGSAKGHHFLSETSMSMLISFCTSSTFAANLQPALHVIRFTAALTQKKDSIPTQRCRSATAPAMQHRSTGTAAPQNHSRHSATAALYRHRDTVATAMEPQHRNTAKQQQRRRSTGAAAPVPQHRSAPQLRSTGAAAPQHRRRQHRRRQHRRRQHRRPPGEVSWRTVAASHGTATGCK